MIVLTIRIQNTCFVSEIIKIWSGVLAEHETRKGKAKANNKLLLCSQASHSPFANDELKACILSWWLEVSDVSKEAEESALVKPLPSIDCKDISVRRLSVCYSIFLSV
jgi:hypothetical protein